MILYCEIFNFIKKEIFMIRYPKQILIFMLIHSTTLLFAEIDIQTSIYDAAEEMIAFDEKMNKAIAKHNGYSAEEDADMRMESMQINDFEERENSYILEQEVPNIEETNIEVKVVGNLLLISSISIEEENFKNDLNITKSKTTTSFTTSLFIPNDADETKMTKSYENNKITIIFPKK